jgi:hypothetical protein
LCEDEALTLLLLSLATRTPTGFITKPATILGTKPAPFMAAFSSQGPNTVTPEILKVLLLI